MTARSKKTKARAANPVQPQPLLLRPLKGFYHGGGVVDGFGMARFYWPDGEGERESIEPRVLKKRRPAGAGSQADTAAKIEALPPAEAPQDYADPDFLIRHYQATLPAEETIAYIQVTLRFGDCANLHHPFEVAREWVRSFYIKGHGIPALHILHAPHLAGSDADGHVHALLLPRRLGRMGWMGIVRDLGSDAAASEARRAWTAFKEVHLPTQ